MTMLGVVLAGGQSTRMGRDKAQVVLGHQTLLSHALTRLARQVDDLAVNKNEHLPEWAGPYISDLYARQMGPLLGVLSALRYARDAGFDQVVTVPVDAPFFPNDLVAVLSAAHGDIVLAACDNPDPKRCLQPTFGLWDVGLHDALDQFLCGGGRKVMHFVDQNNWQQVNWPQAEADAFFNINTADDLAIAQQRIKDQE